MLRSSPTRAMLLVASLVSACAASDPGELPGLAGRPLNGEAGNYLAGQYAASRMDLDTAADSLLKALQADPDNLLLQQQAFGPAVLAGRPEALDIARKLPTNPAATLVLADADVKAGAWRAAEAKFASLPAQGATQVLQPLLRAWAEQGDGATDEALNTLRPFVEGTRYRGVFALHAALINDQAGRMADAARLYRLALVEYGAHEPAPRHHRRQLPGPLRAGQRGARHLAGHGAVQPGPLDRGAGDAAGDRRDEGADRRGRHGGGISGAGGQPAAAGRGRVPPHAAAPGAGPAPGFTAARLLAAELQATGGQIDAARALLTPVPASDPLAALVQLRLALYAERLGQTAEAASALEQLADSYRQRPEPLALLAQLQRGEGRFADAAATYGRAIARIGQPSRADWALYYEQGLAYDRAHDWPAAEAAFLHALDLSPDEPYVLNYLGYAWTEQGRNLSRARQMIERAVELRPNDGSIVDSLGWVLLQQGDTAGAVRFLERAVELDPEDATVNGHLGDAYMAAGRRREAEVQWRRALILNPEPQEAAALHAKLAAPATLPPAVAERRVE